MAVPEIDPKETDPNSPEGKAANEALEDFTNVRTDAIEKLQTTTESPDAASETSVKTQTGNSTKSSSSGGPNNKALINFGADTKHIEVAGVSTFDADGNPIPELATEAGIDEKTGERMTAEHFKELHDKFKNKVKDIGGDSGPNSFGGFIKRLFTAKKTQLKLESKLRSRLGNQVYEDGVQKPLDKMNQLHAKKPDNWTAEDIKDYNEASAKIDKTLESLDKEWLQEQNLKNAEESNPGKKPTKLETLVKLLGILSVVGLSITALVVLNDYANDHSGCLKIHAGSDTNYVQNFKVYCKSGLLPADNTANMQVTFLPSQCYCKTGNKKLTTNPVSSDCNCGEDASNCKDTSGASSSGTSADYNDQIGPCDPEDGGLSGDPSTFTYYSYIVMSPIDAAIDVVSKTVDLGGSLLAKILKFIIGIAIVIASLIGVYIIYLIVKHFMSKTETVKFGKSINFRSPFNSIPVSSIKQFRRY